MFNASGIVQNILSGKLTYTEVLRDITTVQQMSSNAIGPDYFVNVLAAMGVRLTLDGEKLVTTTFDAHASITSPISMRAASHDLPLIKNEPFVMLPGHRELYARVEIIVPESLTLVVYREVLDIHQAFHTQRKAYPSQMVCFPVMSLTDGKVKLVRMSHFGFAKSSAAFLDGAPATVSGHQARKRIHSNGTNLVHSFDLEQASIEATKAMEPIKADFAQANTLTYEQGCMLRTLLDTRRRNARSIQARASTLHNEPANANA